MAKALVIVDMLRDFIDLDGKLSCGAPGAAIVPACVAHLARHREAGDVVVYLCDRHRPDDPEFEMFPPHCVAGTPGAEVIDALAPRAGEIVLPKRRYSGFFQTELDLSLREKGVTDIALLGVCTHICVLYTAADARNRGYAVTVYTDAVAGLSEEAHRWALQEMGTTLGCTLVPEV